MDPRGPAGAANAPPARPLERPHAEPAADAPGTAPWLSTSTDRPPRLPDPQPPPWQSTAAVQPPWRAPSPAEPGSADDSDPYDAHAPLAADIEASRIPIMPDWPAGASFDADPVSWPPVPTDFRPSGQPGAPPQDAGWDPLAWPPMPGQSAPAGATAEPAPEGQQTVWDPTTWQPEPVAPVDGQPWVEPAHATTERVFEPARVSAPYDEVAEILFTDGRPSSTTDGPRREPEPDKQPSSIQVALLTVLVALAVIGLVIFVLATFTSLLG